MNEWRGKNIKILKKFFSASNYLFLFVSIISLFNVFLLSLPLTKYLGYEYSVLNSIFIVLISGIYTIVLLNNSSAEKFDIKEVSTKFITSHLIFVLVPIIISLFGLFRIVTCPFIDGIKFYTVLTLPAPIIGISLGLISFNASRKFKFPIFFGLLIVICSIPVLEIYFNPQIYFYNPLVGFFPGTIYDEAIEIDAKLIVYRLINIFYFGLLIYLLLQFLSRRSKYSIKTIMLVAVVLPLILVLISPYLGYSTTKSRIKKVLDKTLVSQHFNIHYASGIEDSLIKTIALHHEYSYAELRKYFNETPKGKITSYIFNSREEKGELFGSSNADVAKPWLSEIYITLDNYDKTLKHEIAHCFAGEFGSTIFNVADNFNPSLIEGIAMAADPIHDDFDLDYMAALAFNHGYKIDIKKLFKSFDFFLHPSSLGYII
ncbi:MAG: hypothetical protein HXY50_05430, partial [Ignavibacteriaceae bacterium]|nr:hypothetical protein [Ignavibacteriaceae bacterium]